jgi:hypothetical protein
MSLSAMSDPIQKTSFLPPVGKIGHYLALLRDKGKTTDFYSIRFLAPLPEKVLYLNSATTATLVKGGVTPGTTDLTAEGSSSDIRLQPFELTSRSNTMLQLRYVPLDDIEVTLKKPKTSKGYSTANVSFVVTPRITAIDPSLAVTEFIVFEDEKVYMDIYNPTKQDAVHCRIMFMGWYYTLENINAHVDGYNRYLNRIYLKDPKTGKTQTFPVTFLMKEFPAV